jgi:hypothetical protein
MDVRKALTLLEAADKIATPSELVSWAHSAHHNPEDFEEGNLENRIWKFTSYVLKDLPVSSLNAPWHVNDGLVQDYVERLDSGSPMPPIIYDADEDVVIDGTHRIEAAKEAGLTTIQAYVGLPENIDPDWSED